MAIAKKIGKIALIVLLSLVTFIVLLWGGINLAKFGIYADYYAVKADVCTNPGLNDGFVCQGITYVEEEDKILVCGYMTDKSASRIYVTDKYGNSYYVSLQKKDGSVFKGHAGGISYYGDKIYLANDDAIHVIPLSAVLTATSGATVSITQKIAVNNQASFIYADETHLYVGEFHDGENYVTEHPYETPHGTNYAIVERFDLNDLTQPDKVYSIPNKVQGFCYANGKIVLSTSYGLADSHYYVYEESEAYDSGEVLNGAPVYFLGDCKRDLKGPAMAEGLDYMDGKVITLTESASNKYVFGKFFFAFQIVALDIV
ncbi:MAG: hypothetical protein IKC37_06120 [Clostridia bacterium]|nr:hypothetical protein [Clostridia bacterium]